MAVDAFLKFDGLGGEGQKLGNDFDRLGDSFGDLGGAFIKLVDAEADVPKKRHLGNVKFDDVAIARDFHKISQDFVKLDDPLHKFDDSVVKFTDQFIKVTPSDGQTPFPLAADFLKFENDLKATGLDFLKAAPDIKSDAPAESLSLNFSKISVDYKAQSADALKISEDVDDFVRISGISESPKLAMAFFKYSADWQNISDAYLKLSADFQQISTDFAPTEGNEAAAPLKFDQAVHKFAADFTALSQDLKLADTALGGLGGDFHKLADALQNAGPATTPIKLG